MTWEVTEIWHPIAGAQRRELLLGGGRGGRHPGLAPPAASAPFAPQRRRRLEPLGQARLNVVALAPQVLEDARALYLAPENLEGPFQIVVLVQNDFGHLTITIFA